MPLLTNREIAETLERYANLASIAGENAFRSRAFQRAADVVRNLHEPVIAPMDRGDLRRLPGIGSGIADAIETLVRTGALPPFDALQRTVPATLLDLLQVPGVGVKTATRVYRELGVVDLPGLLAAAESGRIRALPGLGPKTEANILAAMEALRRRTGRFLLGTALPLARRIVADLQGTLPAGSSVAISGSVRRMEETVVDIDLVVSTPAPEAIPTTVAHLPLLSGIVRHDNGFLRVTTHAGIPMDIVVVDPSVFGTALIRATGSAEHLALLPDVLPTAPTEEAVYAGLNMEWIAPELRQGLDEVMQAKAGTLPTLLSVGDVRGEFHAHTLWSDGTATILDMVRSAAERGYAFLGVSDHSRALGVANGLDAARLAAQRQEIEKAQRATGLRVFASCEVEVHRDGSLDFDDHILEALDLVIASTHSGLRQPRDVLTERLLRVIANPHVDIIAHPSGRLVERREGGDFDWNRVFAAAAASRTALEINASPERLDLNHDLARRALEAGCLLTINCDAHSTVGFDALEYGVAVARRAGADPDRIVNCWPIERIEAWLETRQT